MLTHIRTEKFQVEIPILEMCRRQVEHNMRLLSLRLFMSHDAGNSTAKNKTEIAGGDVFFFSYTKTKKISLPVQDMYLIQKGRNEEVY